MEATEEERVASSRRHDEFARMLRTLARPEAFPSGVSAEQIEIVQTHASAVLLTGDRAYKLKKPNDFGFFDYSTPALRRHFCGEEVRLNKRLAPHVYLGVAPVLESADGSYRFAQECDPDKLPAPSDTLDSGRVADYAVVMVRLPEAATLEARAHTDDATPELIAAVAERIAAFHASSRTDEHISHFGSAEVVQHNWDENFAQMQPFVGRALDADMFAQVRHYVDSFLRRRRPLFESRQQAGRIRDCHGDLRLQHVYWLGQSPESPLRSQHSVAPDSLAIIDCIEFNERFRYSDVAAEIAFLTMELDAAGRPDLARVFTDAYVARTGDETSRELLPFYACYRACVRAKVLAFQLDEPEVPVDQREAARQQAQQLFALASRYASAPEQPALLMVGGLMGVGKSTLARRLAHELGWVVLSSDAVRKELAGITLTQLQDAPYGQGIYTQGWSERTYRAILERAEKTLATGRSVILDASFGRQSDREAVARLAASRHVSAWFVECGCPREVALLRLASRWRNKQDAVSPAGAAVATTIPRPEEAAPLEASDGRPALYDTQAAAWQPFESGTESHLTHVLVDTSGATAEGVSHVMDALGIMQAACWL